MRRTPRGRSGLRRDRRSDVKPLNKKRAKRQRGAGKGEKPSKKKGGIPPHLIRYRVRSLYDEGQTVYELGRAGQCFKLYMGREHARKDDIVSKTQALFSHAPGLRHLRVRTCGAHPVVVYPREEGAAAIKVEHLDYHHLRHNDEFTLVPDSIYRFRAEIYQRPKRQKESVIGRKVVQKRDKPKPISALSKDELALARFHIAMPCIPLPHCKFNVKRAAEVGVRSILRFLKAHPSESRLMIHIVDGNREALHFQRLRREWEEKGNKDPRVKFLVGDITRMHSRHQSPCMFVVNPSDTIFSTVQPVNKLIFDAAGMKEFRRTTHSETRHLGDLSAGFAIEIPIKAGARFRVEGVRYVIHAIAPNMNPAWPQCLEDDYEVGTEQLNKCYDSLFNVFWTKAMDEEERANPTEMNEDLGSGNENDDDDEEVSDSEANSDMEESEEEEEEEQDSSDESDEDSSGDDDENEGNKKKRKRS